MYSHQSFGNLEIAQQAAHIEIDRLREPVGKQDQYIAAMGGITGFTFHADERVDVEPLQLDSMTRNKLEDNLLLFYTGVRRSASEVLKDERAIAPESADELRKSLDLTREIGYQTRDILLDGDLDSFGALLTEQWLLKYRRQPSPLHDQVDGWIQQGIRAGAAGGKLVGAGGGGFLLFYADRRAELREVMLKIGLTEVGFRVDYEGSTVTVAN
jgi:D-glycero-alpha-D-manno-heptose-7-phosphate kinase